MIIIYILLNKILYQFNYSNSSIKSIQKYIVQNQLKYELQNINSEILPLIYNIKITKLNQDIKDDTKLINGMRIKLTTKQKMFEFVNACKRDHFQSICFLFIFNQISLAPIQKLISSDRLTFIPNLYYQQYRLLDVINENRIDYPQQKILVPRQQSSHDFLMCQMRKNHFILEQQIKYRKVICFHLAKCSKQEFFKRKLKLQEKQLFHRIAFSQLGQSVWRRFDQNKVQNGTTQKKDEIKQIHQKIRSKFSDDIFMDKQEDQDSFNYGSDLLNGIFEDRAPPVQQKQQIPQVASIEDYMKKVNQQCDSSKECKKLLNRKQCLKKINQNIRKRIKSKINQQSGQKSLLNSATVLINSLIGSQPDLKQGEQAESLYIDPPAQTEFLSNLQGKTKKKKQENFELKWNKDLLEQFQQRNSKFDISKSKYQSNYLTANLMRDEKQYQKIFHKNIVGKQPFPPTLNSIPSLDILFKTNPYYNTSADKEFEQFVKKHNKKAKFQKFRQIANFALADSGYVESEPSNIAKLFLTQQEGFSDRVIYKVNNNKIVPINSVQQKVNLTQNQILLLSFLVKRYLCIFGSNWRLITTLILTHPTFSSMYLNTQQIQQLYQIPRQNENRSSIQQINMMNKKILPSSIFVNNSYEQMKPERKMQPIYEQMTDQNQQNRLEQMNNVDLSNYQDLINEPLNQHQQPQEYIFYNTAKLYEDYVNNTKLPSLHEPNYSLTQSLSNIISQFEGKTQIRFVENKQPSKFNQCSDWVLQKVKNQIKFTTPTRKRKNITDKSSQLVKILHTLKQKVQNPTKQPLPQARALIPPAQNTVQPVKPSVTTPNPTPAPTPTPQPAPPTKKTLPKQKPQEKKQKPKQPRKKKQGKDQKQPEKQPESK